MVGAEPLIGAMLELPDLNYSTVTKYTRKRRKKAKKGHKIRQWTGNPGVVPPNSSGEMGNMFAALEKKVQLGEEASPDAWSPKASKMKEKKEPQKTQLSRKEGGGGRTIAELSSLPPLSLPCMRNFFWWWADFGRLLRSCVGVCTARCRALGGKKKIWGRMNMQKIPKKSERVRKGGEGRERRPTNR